MCLILFAYHRHPHFPLIMLANRDEFYSRPSLPAAFWPDHPQILAGRDLEQSGTWMGITREGRFAAITNYRVFQNPRDFHDQKISRGVLVSDFLTGNKTPEAYLREISGYALKYNGFNLLVGDRTSLFYYCNYEGTIRRVQPGIHGLSNHLLDTDWPKVRRGREQLTRLVTDEAAVDEKTLWPILLDKTQPSEDQLPQTGLSPEWEQLVAPAFIEGPDYGTRANTILLMDTQGKSTFCERHLTLEKTWETRRFILEFSNRIE